MFGIKTPCLMKLTAPPLAKKDYMVVVSIIRNNFVYDAWCHIQMTCYTSARVGVIIAWEKLKVTC